MSVAPDHPFTEYGAGTIRRGDWPADHLRLDLSANLEQVRP